nr:hypothetical protein [Candidatus Sigynarchaeum springense]
MRFRFKRTTNEWVGSDADGTKHLATTAEFFTLWDLLVSAFKPGDAGGW